MPTYLQLQSEPWWGAQFTPPVMTAELLDPLRGYFGLGPGAIGAAGDNNHLYGRHRSRNWCLNSRYCTNRAYGTRDARDLQGNGDWYRAFDVGIKGQALYDASRRMDTLARSGACPGLAEWFGTFDGTEVVGWYEGHPSTSDDSHLYHLHGGVWTQYADDPTTMRQLYAAVTGEGESMTPEEFNLVWANAWITQQLSSMTDPIVVPAHPTTSYPGYTAPNFQAQALRAAGDVDEAAIAAALASNQAFADAIAAGVEAGPTIEEIEDAAFRGAQQAEDQ